MLHNFVGSNVQFNYGFDNANQMATHRVSDPANFRWTPPAPSTTAYGTASNINQYPTVGGIAQTYSTDGCLTNDGTFKYEFNTERMMTRVRNAGTNAIIADYLYDPALRQRQKNVGGVKTNYYYAGFQRLADYDVSAGTPGTLLNRYVYGLGMDEVLIQITAGGTKTYYHSNHQGSVIATTNSSGAVLNRYTYGPFGESAALTGTTHGYTGQRYDAETGLYYCKMRHYSSKLGRFLQPDPIGMAGGINLYAYVGNSPLQATDSMGLAADGGGGSSASPARKPIQGGLAAMTIDPFATIRKMKTLEFRIEDSDGYILSKAIDAAAALVKSYLGKFGGLGWTFGELYQADPYLPFGVTTYSLMTFINFGGKGEGNLHAYTADIRYYDTYSTTRNSDTNNTHLGKFEAANTGLKNPPLFDLFHTTVWVPITRTNRPMPPGGRTEVASSSVRLGYAGFGGALQGYTFDVLTRQWVTDYDFFLLAQGG